MIFQHYPFVAGAYDSDAQARCSSPFLKPGIRLTMAAFKFAEYASMELIVTIVSPAFGKLAEDDQLKRMARLQFCAEAAGICGTVVPVWKNDDTYEFLSPRKFEEFLKNVQWTEILGNIKGQFSCA